MAEELENNDLFFETASKAAVANFTKEQTRRRANEATVLDDAKAIQAAQTKANKEVEDDRLEAANELAEEHRKEVAEQQAKSDAMLADIEVPEGSTWKSHSVVLRNIVQHLKDNQGNLIETHKVEGFGSLIAQANSLSDQLEDLFARTHGGSSKVPLNKEEQRNTYTGANAAINEGGAYTRTHRNIIKQEDVDAAFIKLGNTAYEFGIHAEGYITIDGTPYQDWIQEQLNEISGAFRAVPQAKFFPTAEEAVTNNWTKNLRVKDTDKESTLKALRGQLTLLKTPLYESAAQIAWNRMDPSDREGTTIDDQKGYGPWINSAQKEFEEEFMAEWKKRQDKINQDAEDKERKKDAKKDYTFEQAFSDKSLGNTDASANESAQEALQIDKDGKKIGPWNPIKFEDEGVETFVGFGRSSPSFSAPSLKVTDEWGLSDNTAKITSAAFNDKGHLYVHYNGKANVSQINTEDSILMEKLGISEDNFGDQKTYNKDSYFQVEWGSDEWVSILKDMGRSLGVSPTQRTKLQGKISSSDVDDLYFYLGVVELANATNPKYYKNVVQDLEEDGINADELRTALEIKFGNP